MLNQVYVYQDDGASALSFEAFAYAFKLHSSLSHLHLSPISASQVIEGSWKKHCCLFILPGGRDIPYHEKLKGQGNEEIRLYVEQGGRFLGVCAGAYFASREVVFEKGKKNEVHANRELAFFPGTTWGTLYEDKPFSYLGHESAHAALINFKNEPLHVYYNGGCSFLNPTQFSNVEVLSQYLDLKNQPPAIIECVIQKGKAILSGVHFELNHRGFLTQSSIASHLKESEEKRKELFAYLIHRLID